MPFKHATVSQGVFSELLLCTRCKSRASRAPDKVPALKTAAVHNSRGSLMPLSTRMTLLQCSTVWITLGSYLLGADSFIPLEGR